MEKNNENMAQPSAFSPLMNKKEKFYQELDKNIREITTSKKNLFNKPENWPIYKKYLPCNHPQYVEF